MSKFDAAIAVLRRADEDAFVDDYGPAIRVLEAAGKVDKARLLSLIDGSTLRHALIGGGAADPQMYATDSNAETQLHALLDALPDKDYRLSDTSRRIR